MLDDKASDATGDQATDSIEILIELRCKLAAYRAQTDAVLAQLRATEERLMETLFSELRLREEVEELQKRPSKRFGHRLKRIVFELFLLRRRVLFKRSNQLFDAKYYRARYPDVRGAGINSYAHYLEFGGVEGRFPNPMFDTAWYLDANPDVKASGQNALEHYSRHGAGEGRDPHPLFHTDWYFRQQPNLEKDATNPLEHYLKNLSGNRLHD